MIEFITLLLGLVSGTRTVDVACERPAIAVELRLDGAVVGSRGEAPWRFEVDLGAELAPHELIAVGLDAAGAEVARAHQWINLPRSPAEARLALDTDVNGWPVAARLTWASLWSGQPEEVDVWFDGRRLAVSDPLHFGLPRYDREEIHVLTAELRFAHGQRAHAEASFGGVFGERVTTELTAVPIAVSNGRRMPQRLGVDDAFVGTGGEKVAVVSVEAAGADIVVVRDQTSQQALRAAIADVERRMLWTFFERSKDLIPLRRNDRVRFVWPLVSLHRGRDDRAVDPGLFAASAGHLGSEGGLHWLLSRVERPPLPQRIADAVAVAGVSAATAGRPRAVVLVVDPATPDRSSYSAAAVRRYLARLHVPLFVWTTADDPGAHVREWGEVTSVAAWRDLQAAVRDLRGALDRQSIVWVDGAHLPQSIRLRAGVEDLEIAGAAAGSPGAASPPGGG